MFAVGERAYRAMITTQRTQTLLLLGRSGAGKTANLRHLLYYFLYYSHPLASLTGLFSPLLSSAITRTNQEIRINSHSYLPPIDSFQESRLIPLWEILHSVFRSDITRKIRRAIASFL